MRLFRVSRLLICVAYLRLGPEDRRQNENSLLRGSLPGFTDVGLCSAGVLVKQYFPTRLVKRDPREFEVAF